MTKSLPPKSLVLYADDDPDDQELVKQALDEYSSFIDLKFFDDGHQLISYLQTRPPFHPDPCLIMLDINMPKMDGKTALKTLREMTGYKDVPVVLFSTSTMPAEIQFAASYNAGFITKPLYTHQINKIADDLITYCSSDLKDKIKKKRGY